MILIGLGANLLSPVHGTPLDTLTAVLAALEREGIAVNSRSRWYETAPVPVSDQPWYVNAVVSVATALDPAALLHRLHALEAEFGRVRVGVNAPRVVDLDLLAFDDRVLTDWPILPHPRLHERAFVLQPLLDVAPVWRHPVTQQTVLELLNAVDPTQRARLLASEADLI